MPDYTFGVRLAPEPGPAIKLKSMAEVEAESQQLAADRVKLRALQDQERKQQLLLNTLKKHVLTDRGGQTPGIGVDETAVLSDLYLQDPEVAAAYEEQITNRDLMRAKGAQEVGAKRIANAKDATSFVAEALAPIDTRDKTPEGMARASALYKRAISEAKGLNIPIDPEDEEYDPAKVEYWRDRAIGASKKFTEQNDLSQNQYNQDAATTRTNITTQGALDRARIAANAGITKAQISASAKSKGDAVSGGESGYAPTSANPFDGRFRMTSDVGPRSAPMKGASTNHAGRDYAVPLNTPVPAKTGGVVVSAGPQGGYGNRVRIKFDDGSEQSYSHLNRINVKPGQRVNQGQVVALTGSTGKSTGPHVHVEDHGASREVTPVTVAEDVMKYKGPSKLTKGGQIALRTHPDIKLNQTLNIDRQINAISNALGVLKNGGQTGPGTGVQNAIDRGAVALNSLTGGIVPTGDRKAQEARINAYDAIEAVSTAEAIAALAGIGGNDTDKDFERARATTVSNLRTKNYNTATLETAREMYKLQKERGAFITRWANRAGDPNGTINGQTAIEAWDAYAKKRMANIGKLALKNGLVKGGSAPKAAASKATPDTQSVKPQNAIRKVKDAKGVQFWQMRDGSLKRVK